MAKMVNRYNPQILILIKTKRKQGVMESFRTSWRFDMCLVDCEGKSSGLALLWTKQANLEIVSFSKHHIDAKVGGDDDSS